MQLVTLQDYSNVILISTVYSIRRLTRAFTKEIAFFPWLPRLLLQTPIFLACEHQPSFSFTLVLFFPPLPPGRLCAAFPSFGTLLFTSPTSLGASMRAQKAVACSPSSHSCVPLFRPRARVPFSPFARQQGRKKERLPPLSFLHGPCFPPSCAQSVVQDRVRAPLLFRSHPPFMRPLRTLGAGAQKGGMHPCHFYAPLPLLHRLAPLSRLRALLRWRAPLPFVSIFPSRTSSVATIPQPRPSPLRAHWWLVLHVNL